MKQSGRRKRATPRQLDAKEKALLAQTALADKRALDPVVLDMREITLITDFFIICHGTSNVHMRALGDAVVEALKEDGVRPYGVEGRDEGRWVLLDYGDFIVHIFGEEDREFYSLERLWSDAPRVGESESSAI
jgi:ribosome-associated protein